MVQVDSFIRRRQSYPQSYSNSELIKKDRSTMRKWHNQGMDKELLPSLQIYTASYRSESKCDFPLYHQDITNVINSRKKMPQLPPGSLLVKMSCRYFPIHEGCYTPLSSLQSSPSDYFECMRRFGYNTTAHPSKVWTVVHTVKWDKTV